MKKFVVLVALFAAVSGMAFADNPVSDTLTVSASVAKHVYILSAPDLSLGVLDVVSGGTDSDNVKIRSNHSSWTFAVYADKGALTQWTGSAYVTTPGATTVPYTFTFNSAGTLTETAILSGITVPVTAATAGSTATFAAKTMGGASGQDFVYKVDVAGAEGGAAWDAANYQDVLHFVVTAL